MAEGDVPGLSNIPIIKGSGDSMRRVRYECRNCGAEDYGKFYENEAIPMFLHCWQCKAGMGKTPQQMHDMALGMAVTGPDTRGDAEAERALKEASGVPPGSDQQNDEDEDDEDERPASFRH